MESTATKGSWRKIGDLIVPFAYPDVVALDASSMAAIFRSAGDRLTLEDGATVSASRWVVFPVLVTGLVDGRACLWVEGRGGSARVETADIAALRAGHVSVGERWFTFDPDSLEQVTSVLGDLGVALGPLTVRQLLELRSARMDPLIFEDRVSDVSPEIFGSDSGAPETPNGVTAELYPYQLAGWKWLSFLSRHELGGLLADEMGLGKTLQVIALLADAGGKPMQPALVIAPGTLLENWRRELSRFAPSLRVLVHAGPGRTGSPRELRDYNAVITSYDTVVRDNGLMATVDWDAVVIDEAQAIRNPGTIRSAAVGSLRRRRGIAITGTPIENRLLDLWSIMNFVAPGHLGTMKEFEAAYPDDPDGARRLEPLVSPLMLRRRVTEVAKDLPERIDIDVPLLLPPDDAKRYDEIRREAMAEYGLVGPMVAITKLRQFCGHPIVLGEPYAEPDAFPKLERLLEIAEEIFASGQKFILFSAFTAVSDLIVSTLRRRLGAWVDQMDGRDKTEFRQDIVDRFSAVNGPAALILNPRVAAAGLNITAATHVVHYGLEWNPALEAQASARAWRRGQDRPVTIHRLFFAGTVEEVMNDRLGHKRDLSDAAVVGVEGTDEDRRDALAALAMSPLKDISQ